jgi:hypothetical protein
VSTGLGTSGTHGERNPELTNTGLGSNTQHSTTHGTANPLDRNNDGRMGAGDLTGSHGTSGYGNTTGSTGLGSSNTHGSTGLGSSTTHGTANPLDRNNDGRIGAGDLTGSHGTSGYGNTTGSTGLGSSNTHGSTGLGSSTTHGSTGLGSSTHGTANPLDRNNDGRVGAGDLTGNRTGTHGTTGLGSSNTHGTTGLGSSNTHGTHGTANPLDRNNDGRVGAGDLTGAGGQYSQGSHGTTGGLGGHSGGHGTADYDDRVGGAHNTRLGNVMHPHGETGSTGAGLSSGGLSSGNTHSGLAGSNTHSHGTANPLDRNNDGRVGAGDLTGNRTGTHGSTGLGSSTHGTANPLDRNNDGRVGAGDLTGAGGVGAGQYSGNTHGGLAGSNTHSHGTANPLDRNNDGRVGASDLSGNTHSSSGMNTHGGIAGTSAGYGDNTTGLGHSGTTGTHHHTVPGEVDGTGRNDLSHRTGEDGGLPKALTEDVSRAEPHSSLTDDQHHTGTHGTTHGTHDAHTKPSLMDKLNPKKDADGDGKAGFMK